MASTTDFTPAVKTYKATRPNPDEAMDLETWYYPIGAISSGVGWGANFRNLEIQSLSIAGWVDFTHDGDAVGNAKPTVTFNQKVKNHTASELVEAFETMVEQLTDSDTFAEATFGDGATAAENPDKANYRAVVKGEVLISSESGWMDFTATFTMKKVELSNYLVQGVPGPKVDEYLETLDGYKTEA